MLKITFILWLLIISYKIFDVMQYKKTDNKNTEIINIEKNEEQDQTSLPVFDKDWEGHSITKNKVERLPRNTKTVKVKDKYKNPKKKCGQ